MVLNAFRPGATAGDLNVITLCLRLQLQSESVAHSSNSQPSKACDGGDGIDAGVLIAKVDAISLDKPYNRVPRCDMGGEIGEVSLACAEAKLTIPGALRHSPLERLARRDRFI
jgi:hypothetical protein